jgi:hypothetical protein
MGLIGARSVVSWEKAETLKANGFNAKTQSSSGLRLATTRQEGAEVFKHRECRLAELIWMNSGHFVQRKKYRCNFCNFRKLCKQAQIEAKKLQKLR